MKAARKLVDPYTSTRVPEGTIGVAMQVIRPTRHISEANRYAVTQVTCYAVFPNTPLEALPQQMLPQEQQPRRELYVLRPGQKVRIKVWFPLDSISNCTFHNKGGVLHVRPAYKPWSRKRLEATETGKCHIARLTTSA